MRWTIRNLAIGVTGYNEQERRWLSAFLSYEDKVYQPSVGVRRKLVCLFNTVTEEFPAGLARVVYKAAKAKGFEVEINDVRAPACAPDPDADLEWLHSHPAVEGEITHQVESVEAVIKNKRGVLWLPTGAGKCLGLGTPVLRYDGHIVPVETIDEGDLLMGPDSKPRKVTACVIGSGPMYRIVPKKGTTWTCNGSHVLTLVHTVTGDVEDISVRDYLQKSKHWRHCHKLFQPEQVDFPYCMSPEDTFLPLDPYFLGVWYGDGRRDLRQGVQVSKPDAEIEAACRDTAKAFGLSVRVDTYKSCPTYRLVAPRGRPNRLLRLMRGLVGCGERLPLKYLLAPADERRAFLAGLLDTDGHLANGYYEIVQQRRGVARDIAFLARSLGFRVTEAEKVVNGETYCRLSILGDAMELPLRILRKKPQPRKQKKNVRRVGFTVAPIGVDSYYGFSLSGDGRFLLGDFTVTHNTEIAIGISKAIPCQWLFLVHRADLLKQTAERYELRTGETAGLVGGGVFNVPDDCRFVVTSFQTAHRQLKDHKQEMWKLIRVWAQGVIVDEVHSMPASTFYNTVMQCAAAYYRVGLSGTPMAGDQGRNLLLMGGLGPVIYRVKPEVLINLGLLARPTIRMVEVPHPASDRKTWRGVYNERVVRNVDRNKAVVETVKNAEKPALVFVQAVKHGHDLKKRLEKAGLNARFAWGEQPLAKRKELRDQLERGYLDALVCNVVFQEGIDIPSLRAVVVASGGKSEIAALQRIGRGMRADKATGKTRFEVWDFADVGCGCKPSDWEGKHSSCKWLERHTRARQRAYEREGFTVETAGEQLELV